MSVESYFHSIISRNQVKQFKFYFKLKAKSELTEDLVNLSHVENIDDSSVVFWYKHFFSPAYKIPAPFTIEYG